MVRFPPCLIFAVALLGALVLFRLAGTGVTAPHCHASHIHHHYHEHTHDGSTHVHPHAHCSHRTPIHRHQAEPYESFASANSESERTPHHDHCCCDHDHAPQLFAILLIGGTPRDFTPHPPCPCELQTVILAQREHREPGIQPIPRAGPPPDLSNLQTIVLQT